MPDVLDAVESGEVDLGFVAIENSIEGAVNLTQDELAFNHDLLIQREVVLDIEHCLLVSPGTTIDQVKQVLSIPVATAQCHGYVRRNLPQAEIGATNSTAEAARLVGEDRSGGACCHRPARLAPSSTTWRSSSPTSPIIPATRHGSWPSPSTASRPRTGHDRTALVVYQRADEPGSLISILQEFAARRINLSNLLSRPTKDGGLGDYCFIIYADGHIADEIVADAIRQLRAKQASVKFLGSYPAAGEHAHSAREHADSRWREADDWINELRRKITPS